MKTKTEHINITIDIPDRRRKVKKALPPAVFRRLERKLADRTHEILQHAKKDGWDLDWALLRDEVYQDVFGDDLEWYVMGRFLQAGAHCLKWKDDDFVLCFSTLKRGRKTVKKGRRKVSKSAGEDGSS